LCKGFDDRILKHLLITEEYVRSRVGRALNGKGPAGLFPQNLDSLLLQQNITKARARQRRRDRDHNPQQNGMVERAHGMRAPRS
jgi:hypothetical protein